MKIYKLEFDYFSKSEWKDISIEIIATSILEVSEAFLSETRGTIEENKITEMWNSIKNDIEILESPITTRK